MAPMKIIFLCGSLEPGKDGVGDYTRRLAGDLVRHGQDVGIVALRDNYIKTEFNGFQDVEGIDLPVLRLPSDRLTANAFKRAGEWIEIFNPEWLSLQFVPFSFHAKGLPLRFVRLFSMLGKGRNWHVMVHELWVGMNIEASRKLA